MIEVVKMTEVVSNEDTLLIEKLAKEIWEIHYTPIIGEKQVKYMLDNFQTAKAVKDEIAKGIRYSFIMFEKSIAGYIAYEKRDGEIFLSKLYILKKYRRRGIAEKIMGDLSSKALRSSVFKISLRVNRRNLGSIAFYEKMGFTRLKPVVTDIGGGFVCDDYSMEKNLV